VRRLPHSNCLKEKLEGLQVDLFDDVADTVMPSCLQQSDPGRAKKRRRMITNWSGISNPAYSSFHNEQP
jgi:hypothetical protein